MSKPYDASGKALVEAYLTDWFALCDHYVDVPVELVDADVSSVSAAADKVVKVHADPAWLLHVEWQAHRDVGVVEPANLYNTLLAYRHQQLVHTMLVLLQPSAWFAECSGEWTQEFRGSQPHRIFRYQVVRVWELPLADMLQGPLGVMALAPLTDEARSCMSEVIQNISKRVDAEMADPQAREFWVATEILMGLRYSKEQVAEICRRVRTMKESSVYQAILTEGLEKGRFEGRQEGEVLRARKILLTQGTRRFGRPDVSIRARIEGINDADQLTALCERILDAESWAALFGG